MHRNSFINYSKPVLKPNTSANTFFNILHYKKIHMKSGTFLKLSFALMIVALAFISWLTYNNSDATIMPFLALAQFFSIPFMVTAIVELNNSDRIDRSEKTMWTFGFIALTLITGILYFISQRKRVLPISTS